jgi:iron complex outermembrane receptor protein
MAKNRIGLLHTVALVALGFPLASYAEQAEAQAAPDQRAAPDNANAIGDIVVTAEKRTSTAQRTALSLTVLDKEVLARNGVQTLSDLQSVAPSVAFSRQINQTMVVIRGVSSRDPTLTGNPAVAVSIDGFNLQRSSGLDTSMFDIERVEVLRGPQGTLLGRNATGGAINIITAKPTDTFSASATGEVGNFNAFNTNGYVNLPVSDSLQFRAAFQTRSHSGYRDTSPAEDADDDNAKAFRVTAAFQPTSRLNGFLTYEYFTSQNNPAYDAIPVATYTAANVPPGLLVGDIILQKPHIPDNGRSFPMPPGGYIKDHGQSIRGTLNYDLGFATATYVGGWREATSERNTYHGGEFGTDRQNFAFQGIEHPESWNHELRLSAKPGGKLFWQVGTYYFKESNTVPVSQLVDYPGSPGILGFFVPLQSFPVDYLRLQAKAAFGQVAYELLPGLKIEGGLRYTADNREGLSSTIQTAPNAYLVSHCGQPGYAACVYGVSGGVPTEGNWSKTTYHAGLNYQFTSRNLLYAKFDTGYKAGGFNTDGTTFEPEQITAWEIGSKNRFLDDRLQANFSAFYYDYKNQQVVQTINPPSGLAVTQIVPAGRSHYKGVEADILYKPTADDQFSLFLGYTKAEYIDFKLAVSGLYRRIAAAEGTLDAANNWQLAGRTPPQAPMWVINAGYGHDWHVFGGTLNTRVQTHFESKSYLSPQNIDSDRQDAYTKTDLIIAYSPPSKKWQLQAYVRNIEDSLVLTNSADASSTTFLTYRYQFAAPRTFGTRLTVNW